MAAKTDDETNGCVFQWKIKNISHCWLNPTEKKESPSFDADVLGSKKWSLWLFPKGCTDENYVSIYLNRKDGCSGPNTPDCQFQLAFLGKDGSLLKEFAAKYSFKKGDTWGFPKFIERKVIFITDREAFLPDDTLTVQCILWKGENKPERPKRFYSQTVYKVIRRSFVWRIEDFSTMKSGLRNEFQDGTINFHLVLNQGLNQEKKLLININQFSVKYFSFKVSIVDCEGKKEDCGIHEYLLGDLQKGVLSTLLFTKKLMDNKNMYLSNDVLNLDCEYVYSDGSVLYQYCVCGTTSPKLKNEIVKSKECNRQKEDSASTEVLVNDLKFMYNDAICSDMVLRTSTQSFPAHKGILSARSSVFRKMCGKESKEMNDIVEITDFEDDTVRRMLLYIYTDFLDDLSFEGACKLYAAADKYQIMSLMNRCSFVLKEILCPENACDVLALADLHHDDGLKTSVVDYILRQCKEIFCLREWKDFMMNHVDLATDVILKMVCQE